MWTWLSSYAAQISAIADVAMVLIWLTYLHVFVISYLRSNRTAIHIGMVTGARADARCVIANVGSAPVYLLGVAADMDCAGTIQPVLLTDRLELQDQDLADPRQRTTQGTLGPGEARDIGSFRDLVDRAAIRLGHDLPFDGCEAMTLTAVVATREASSSLQGGFKRFGIAWEDGQAIFSSPDLLTRQIRSGRRRRRLRKVLTE
ncbi:hypothetical protein [Wenxinia saemankumensis]|uniref:Uncharacterized protein n=1 Tax=Wenxinia saemankumensis TaxID=1447782 RepID=A0A1M6AE56_9RHOB|nr:hypothetical protein [Wenxinia saemankumensis]SHI34702.1 hypothetical protein SAMN05444417_0384 [Wenxinia saemankumensis]